MKFGTAERYEETIASVRADLELEASRRAEELRVERKRRLLENIVRHGRYLEDLYQAAKAHKKKLKAIRGDLTKLDTSDLGLEELEEIDTNLRKVISTDDAEVRAIRATFPPLSRAAHLIEVADRCFSPSQEAAASARY